MPSSRRTFLSRAAGLTAQAAVVGWVPFGVETAAAAQSPRPLDFPADIALYRQRFKNWAQDIVVEDVWTCAARSPDDIVRVCNWARRQGVRVRPRGMMHNWSPLTLAPGQAPADVVLVDTTALAAVSIDTRGAVARVTAQAGVLMDTLMRRMEDQGLGLVASPAPGDLTLGGVLAIGGHGTAIPARGEVRQPGQSFGSLSNAVLALTAVVYDEAKDAYVLRRFERNDPAIAPLLTHVGRAFIVEAVLQAGRNQRLRCRSFMTVSADELFAPPGASGRSFARYVETSGRVEAIWFPFTQYPWMKTWDVAPRYPFPSRPVVTPFNYPFSDNLPVAASNLLQRIVAGETHLTPAFGALEATLSATGLLATLSSDLWGWSRSLLLYVKPSTLRVTANGYAIITRRADVQRVVHEFCTEYRAMLQRYAAAGSFPANGPVEIRVTGLDRPDEVGVAGAVAPALSAVRPVEGHPEWDVAVWLDVLTFPGTPGAAGFYREMEQWMLARFQGWCQLRVEWSKGWGYSEQAAWDDEDFLGATIPQSFAAPGREATEWRACAEQLARLDPHGLFMSPMLERLFR